MDTYTFKGQMDHDDQMVEPILFEFLPIKFNSEVTGNIKFALKNIVNLKAGDKIVTNIHKGVRSGSIRSFSSNSFSYSIRNYNDKLIEENKGKSLVNIILITPELSLIVDDKVNEVEIRNELSILKEKIDRSYNLRKQLLILKSDIVNGAEDFLSKYSKFEPVLGDFPSYLDRRMGKDTLITYLEKQEQDWDFNWVLSSLSKNSQGSVQMDDLNICELNRNNYNDLDYNTQLLNSYGKFISELDTMELNSNSNDLNYGLYLINEQLENKLINGWKDKNLNRYVDKRDNKKSFYLVVFNVLKSKNKNTNKEEITFITIYNIIKFFFILFKRILLMNKCLPYHTDN